jgi:DNA-binding response OmpR family regulator
MILIRNSGTVVDRKTISRMIYKNELNASTRRIDMKINHIRKKLGDHSEMIRTVWGVGYEFIPRAQS